MLTALEGILVALELGTYGLAAGLAALEELGLFPVGIATVAALINYVQQQISALGGSTMASATAPVPVLTPSTAGAGICATKSGNRGICCAAVTQLGLARAAQGFQYTNCNGKTVCLACGTKASVSKKHPGQTVFSVKRVTCGPSGCPALGQQGGTIVAPV